MSRYGAGFAFWSGAAELVVLFTDAYVCVLLGKAGVRIPTLPDWLHECKRVCLFACSEYLVTTMPQYAHAGHGGLLEALVHAALYRHVQLLGRRALGAIGQVQFRFNNNWPDYASCVRGLLFVGGAILPFWVCSAARAYMATK